MAKRPAWAKCIQRTRYFAWCGRHLEPFEWAFVDVPYAADSVPDGDRLPVCARCLMAYKNKSTEGDPDAGSVARVFNDYPLPFNAAPCKGDPRAVVGVACAATDPKRHPASDKSLSR